MQIIHRRLCDSREEGDPDRIQICYPVFVAEVGEAASLGIETTTTGPNPPAALLTHQLFQLCLNGLCPDGVAFFAKVQEVRHNLARESTVLL